MTTLARVRGGRTGVRFVSLEDWKAERKAAKGQQPPPMKSRRQERMEAKMRKRAQRKKRKAK